MSHDSHNRWESQSRDKWYHGLTEKGSKFDRTITFCLKTQEGIHAEQQAITAEITQHTGVHLNALESTESSEHSASRNLVNFKLVYFRGPDKDQILRCRIERVRMLTHTELLWPSPETARTQATIRSKSDRISWDPKDREPIGLQTSKKSGNYRVHWTQSLTAQNNISGSEEQRVLRTTNLTVFQIQKSRKYQILLFWGMPKHKISRNPMNSKSYGLLTNLTEPKIFRNPENIKSYWTAGTVKTENISESDEQRVLRTTNMTGPKKNQKSDGNP